jgi:hypothetical protein
LPQTTPSTVHPVISSRWCALLLLLLVSFADGSPQLPFWSARLPNSNAPFDVSFAREREFRTVHNGTRAAPYANGPTIAWWNNSLVAAWYAGVRESVKNNVLLAWSFDVGDSWTRAIEVFPAVLGPFFNQAPPAAWPTRPGIGDENQAFWQIHGRIYAAASSWDVVQRRDEGDGHVGREIVLLRRLVSLGRSHRDAVFGPIFWLADHVPPGFEHCNFDTVRTIDAVARADALELWSQHINTTVDAQLLPNERSFYVLPGDPRRAVLLLRSGVANAPSQMLAATALLPGTAPAPIWRIAHDLQCRPGTGLVQAALVDGWSSSSSVAAAPLQLNWTVPQLTSIPDSHSRTCASVLPDGRVYLIGNQVTSGRSLLTLALSRDGLDFDHVVGLIGGDNTSFQYAGAVRVNETLIVAFSTDKKRIDMVRLPWRRL